MRRIIPILLFLPALILVTSLACGDSTPTETGRRTQSRPTVAPRDAAIASGASAAGYLLIAGNAIQSIGDSLQNIGALTADPKVGDMEWTIDVAVETTGIEIAYQELLGLEPPQELADLHSAVLDAALDCKQGKDFFVQGVDNLDADSLERASELINSCGRKMDTAQSLLDQYLETSGQQDPSELSPHQDVPNKGNATVNNGANLRAGPSTDFAVVGGAKQGDAIELVARNEAGDWYQLASGEWIAAFLVDDAPPDLPLSSTIPSVPQRSAPVAPFTQPAQPYAECDCSGNLFNCSDFADGYDAQACFNFCGGTANDVHDLDRDGDGNACEWKP